MTINIMLVAGITLYIRKREIVTKMSIKGNTEPNPRSVLQESPPISMEIYHLGDGCHSSTKLNDTSEEAQIIPSESHNL